MSRFIEKIVIPRDPIEMTLPGNVRVAVFESQWIPMMPGETPLDHFIVQRGNYSGILWSSEYYSSRLDSTVKVFKVKSSDKVSEYTVTKTGKDYKCNCDGYAYRKRCRHCDEVKSSTLIPEES